MKVIKIMLALMLCGISVLSLSCTSESDADSMAETQIATVQRGDLTVDITASGNLALSVVEDLAFEMAGTVEEILVEDGDSVTEGQLLAKLDTSEWEKELTTLELNLLQAEINLDNAELTLEQAEDDTSTSGTGDILARTTDPKEIDILELKVKLAEARYEDAKEALAEALDASPEVVAPFDGFITKVLVEGGEEIKKGTVAVTIADPNKFEADILVSEMDILQVELGGIAYVEVDAMTGLSLPAEVIHISPTATIQSGVVNYQVKVEVQSLEAVMQERQQARQEAMGDISSGEIPERLQQAIEQGQMTQEEAEAMLEQMQQGLGEQQGQGTTAILEDFQLREGLTVTVSVIVEEATDVLLVPNGAITTQGGQTYMQVVSADGTIEERGVTTGISNWQYTEVTEGLSEGEQVVVPEGTATTTTTGQQGPQGGGMLIPGMGRPR
ncbi:efflux RND transporter periplasmic adaptor subunit [Chloroflexota bacterium]